MPRCARAVWIYFKKNDLFRPNKFPYFVGVRTDVCNERQSTDIDDGKRKCQIVDVDKNPFSSFGHTILQQIHFHVLFLWIFFQFVWHSNDTNERTTWRVSRGTRFKVLNTNCRSSFDRFAWRNCMAASTSNKEICTFVAKEAKKVFHFVLFRFASALEFEKVEFQLSAFSSKRRQTAISWSTDWGKPEPKADFASENRLLSFAMAFLWTQTQSSTSEKSKRVPLIVHSVQCETPD